MPRACVPRGKNSPVRLAAHNECRQSAKPIRSCGDSPRRGEPCSLPGFAGSTVVPRSQPRNIFMARLAKSGRPNRSSTKFNVHSLDFVGLFLFAWKMTAEKFGVQRAAVVGTGRRRPPQGLGNKHKRTRLPRRFLLQVRRFCHKACKMHGFVL